MGRKLTTYRAHKGATVHVDEYCCCAHRHKYTSLIRLCVLVQVAPAHAKLDGL
jgi:hypothetical protein